MILGKLVIEISGPDINDFDPDSVTEAVYGILEDNGYNVTVVFWKSLLHLRHDKEQGLHRMQAYEQMELIDFLEAGS